MLITYKRHKSAGFTLTELMVALVVNGIIFSSLLGVFIANVNHYTKVINTNRLNQQLQSALTMMSMDIRRAGYWANADNDIGSNSNNNPFMSTSSGTDISIGSGGSCILFSYDRSNNGSLPSISTSYDDERYGYRLSGTAIQARPRGAAFSCTASASAWEDMTDPNIVTITNLIFTLTTQTVVTGPGTVALAMRSVDISVTGQLASDASITKTLTQHVRIRNDKFIP